MPIDQTRNVSITAKLNALIRDQVACGQYQDTSEEVRASLRLLMRQAGPGEPKKPPPPDGLQTPGAAVRGRHARQV